MRRHAMQEFYIFLVYVLYLLIFKNEFCLIDNLIIHIKNLFFLISFSNYYHSCTRMSCSHQTIIISCKFDYSFNVPFSERKGYRRLKYVKKAIISFCLSVCSSQSETSFFIFRLFGVLIKLCYRLSMSRNSNPRSDFPSEFSLVRNSTNQKRAFLFFVFSAF